MRWRRKSVPSWIRISLGLSVPLVVLGQRGERGLGFPWHVGVGVAMAVLEDFDNGVASQVQVLARVAVGRCT